MSYQVLARKWRPSNFSQMVGQEHVLQALTNALDSERLHHAYLFSGTRGVGKTTIARIFAKSLNCDEGVSSTPCGVCTSCTEIDQGRSVDLIEIDAASRTGVDDMRELLDNVQYAPTRSRFKIYLIDEVHMLSKHSFNALLKTLEEPPPHIKFLLATTDPQKLPVTVLSRCLQFNLKRMSRAQILSQLSYLTEQEQIDADESALAQLAAAADGSMRDALSLLDQAIGYGAGAVGLDAVQSMLGSISRDYLQRLMGALQEGRAADLVSQARQVIEQNPDYQRVCADMLALLQQIALYQADARLASSEDFDEQTVETFARHWSPDEVQLYYQILLQGRQDLLITPDQASGFEMLMLRLHAFAPQEPIDGAEVKKKPESERLIAQEPAPLESVPQASAPSPTAQTDAQSETPAPNVDEMVSTTSAQIEHESDTAPSPVVTEAVPPAVTSASARPDSKAPADGPDLPAVTAAGQAPAASDHIGWSGLAYELGLTGLAQELVANSECLGYADDLLQLRLPNELFELADDARQGEILQALQQKLGVSLRLQMTAGELSAGATPLQVKLEMQRLERLDAIAAIQQESLVRKLKNAFSAELLEDSVVRTDSSTSEEVRS